MELATALAGLAVVFSYTSSLHGWSPDDMLALVGVYFIAGGMIGLIIEPSLEQFITSVRDGTLDFTLMKPEDAQFLVSLQTVNIWKVIDVVMGVAVLITALLRLGQKVGVWQAASFGLMSLAGLVIIYSFWLMLATLAFWFVRVENILVIFQSMYEAGRWPIEPLPRLAALRSHVRRARGFCHQHPRRGPHRSAHASHVARRSRSRRRFGGPISSRLARRPAPLRRSLCLMRSTMESIGSLNVNLPPSNAISSSRLPSSGRS